MTLIGVTDIDRMPTSHLVFVGSFRFKIAALILIKLIIHMFHPPCHTAVRCDIYFFQCYSAGVTEDPSNPWQTLHVDFFFLLLP